MGRIDKGSRGDAEGIKMKPSNRIVLILLCFLLIAMGIHDIHSQESFFGLSFLESIAPRPIYLHLTGKSAQLHGAAAILLASAILMGILTRANSKVSFFLSIILALIAVILEIVALKLHFESLAERIAPSRVKSHVGNTTGLSLHDDLQSIPSRLSQPFALFTAGTPTAMWSAGTS